MSETGLELRSSWLHDLPLSSKPFSLSRICAYYVYIHIYMHCYRYAYTYIFVHIYQCFSICMHPFHDLVDITAGKIQLIIIIISWCPILCCSAFLDLLGQLKHQKQCTGLTNTKYFQFSGNWKSLRSFWQNLGELRVTPVSDSLNRTLVEDLCYMPVCVYCTHIHTLRYLSVT